MFFKKILGNQRGALFGLDARITLAIFSGLSIVAGAAGYSYMSKTQITAVSTELDNISKAYTNFQLDTQVNTKVFTDLVNNDGGQLGWNGPYITMISDNHLAYGKYSLSYGIDMSRVKGTSPRPCLNPRDICFVWASLSEVPLALATKVDEHIDGANDGFGTPDNGKLLVDADLATDKATIHFRVSRKQ